jgi:hypothetical protein
MEHEVKRSLVRAQTRVTNANGVVLPADLWSVDHVKDIGWGGPDELGNAWPLDTERNVKANASYEQYVQYRKGSRRTVARVMSLTGKYFWVYDVRDAGGLNSRTDTGTGPQNPMNGGSLGVPARRP